jgi:hypothetical protein
MATRAGQLTIRFAVYTKQLEKASSRSSKILGGVARGVAVAGVAAAAAVGAVAVQTTKDLMRVERLGAQTEAVIKATGGAAGRSRGQVDALAAKLERMSGAEAETVTEGQNMLLTFKNIKGKQFDQATRAALDMGVAMNKGSLQGLDLAKTNIQLGKALNDPVKGISALSKVGVSFTEQQKDQIKTMVEAGDVTGAQGVILKELQGEFGGAAKAAGKTTEGMAAKIQNSFGNIAEELMSGVLPMLQLLMTWVQQKVMPVLMRFGDWLKNDGVKHLQTFGAFIKDNVIPPIQSLVGWMVQNKDVLGSLAVGIGSVVAAMLVWQAVTKTVAAVQLVLNAVMAANPIGIIILAVAALAAGLVWFFTKTKLGKKIWKDFTGFMVKAWDAVKSGLSAGWQWIKNNVFDPVWRGIKFVGLVFKAQGLVIRLAFNKVKEGLGAAWSWIKRRVFSPVANFITKTIPNAFKTGVAKVKDWWDGLKKAAQVPVKFLVETVWNNGLRKMLNAIPGVSIDPVKLGFAKGGAIRGAGTGTSDSIPAYLSKGEHVWTAKEVAAAGGQKAMYAMRQAVLNGNLNGDPKFAQGGALDAAAIARAQKFASSQAGKPYGWGAVGPGAYDCSGFMSAITNVLEDKYPHSRRGATSSFPWSGFKQGPGQFTVVSTPNYGLSGIGHMAGTLAGTNVESRGGRGVIVGPGAMGAASSGFTQMGHLGAGGKAAMNQGGWFQTIQDVLSTMKKLPGQITEMMTSGGWMTGFLKKMSVGMWKNIAGFVNDKIPGPGPIPATFDNGGTLGRGLNLVNNATGAPERLVRADRQQDGGAPRTVYVDLGDEVMTLIRRKVRDGGGNVQLVLGRGR